MIAPIAHRLEDLAEAFVATDIVGGQVDLSHRSLTVEDGPV